MYLFMDVLFVFSDEVYDEFLFYVLVMLFYVGVDMVGDVEEDE